MCSFTRHILRVLVVTVGQHVVRVWGLFLRKAQLLHNIGESTTIAGLLLREGADVNARDRFGNTPLHEAVRRENPDVVFVLIHSGANVNAR